MPQAPAPDTLIDEDEVRAEQAKDWPAEFQESYGTSSAIQIRPVEPVDLMNPEPLPPNQLCWMKTREQLPDDQRLPAQAYRARLHSVEAIFGEPGEVVDLPVTIENASAHAWQRFERSGISVAWCDLLANHHSGRERDHGHQYKTENAECHLLVIKPDNHLFFNLT